MCTTLIKRNSKLALVLLCFGSLIILGVIQVNESVQNNNNIKETIMRMKISPVNDRIAENLKLKCSAWFEWTQVYRKCVIKYLKNKNENDKEKSVAWRFTHEALSSCSGQAMFDMLNVNFLPNKDDVKLVILPNAENKKISRQQIDTSCIEVTLGVGNDIDSEKRLLKLLPECKLYGADPYKSAGEIFKNIGEYFEIAVGGKTGIFKADVLVGPGIYNYSVKNVSTINFVEFFMEKIKNKNIDYLFMDNEGAEYEILPMFYRGGQADRENLKICQISVELHGPLVNYDMTNARYDELMENLVLNSALLPLWSSAPQNHARMFLIDAESEFCVQKYLSNWCFA